MKNKHPTEVARITIDTGNVIDADDVLRVHPDDALVWVVTNNDPVVTYYVWIDPGEIKQREDPKGVFTNPLQTPNKYTKVKPGETDTLIHKVRKQADFGKAGVIPYTSYKYTIRSSSVKQYDVANTPLDPDIDVITP
jgi:hypothetical protein